MGSSSSASAASKSASQYSKKVIKSLLSSSISSNIVTKYKDLAIEIKKRIENNEGVVKVFLLKSPLAGMSSSSGLVTHHEVIFEIKTIYQPFFLLFSYGIDGLEISFSSQKQSLINRRKDNKISQTYNSQEPFEPKSLKKFIEQNQQRTYNLVDWNCQHYAQKLIEAVRARTISPK